MQAKSMKVQTPLGVVVFQHLNYNDMEPKLHVVAPCNREWYNVGAGMPC